MDLSVATEPGQLGGYVSWWGAFASENPMLSWDWLGAWWEAFARRRQLRVIALKDGDELVGLAPLFLERGFGFETFQLLGSGRACSDYLRFLIAPGREADVAQELASFLRVELTRGPKLVARSLVLEGIEPTAPWHLLFRDAMAERGFDVHQRPLENAWRLELPADWDQLLRDLPSGQRRKARKAVARFDAGELTLIASDATLDSDQSLDVLERLHQARQQTKGNSGCYGDPRFGLFLREAARRLAKKKRARVLTIEANRRPVSVDLELVGTEGAAMYQCGFDPTASAWEPGHALFTASIRDAIARGYRYFDFLRGDEPYKAAWGARPRPLARVTFIPPKVVSRGAFAAARGMVELGRRAKRLLTRRSPTASIPPVSAADRASGPTYFRSLPGAVS